jgi:predicted ATPase
MIQNIGINNFKSFGDDTLLPLVPFSVFVGPNAAGKSNLVDAFRFVQDCLGEGIGPAVTRRYGWANLRCRRRRSTSVSFTFSGVSLDDTLRLKVGKKELTFSHPCFSYSFTFAHQDDDYAVTAESARLSACPMEKDQTGEQQEISAFERTTDKIHVVETVEENEKREQEIDVVEANRGRLFTAATFSSLAGLVISNEIALWRFYDPDPRLARTPSLAQSVVSVSETGDTLALVLHQLRRGQPGDGNGLRQKFLDIVQVIVPGFEDWETEQLADGRIAFKVRERGLRGTLPSLAVSDGTVRLLAILAALFWSQLPPSTIFIEEPERSLHPAVMGQLAALMREASSQTQVIVTTHSPDFVRHCEPGEVYLLDKVDGCTQVVQASSIEQIEGFLKRFTLDQLWLQGYLERGIP